MGLSTLREDAQLAFWSAISILTASAWFLVSYFILKANPPTVGGIAALIAAAGAAIAVVGCLPGNRYRGIALLCLVLNAGIAVYLAPWVLWGL